MDGSKEAAQRAKIIQKFSAKRQVYGTCAMLSVSGALLCHCDRRKLEWYTRKGLAKRVADDPPTIQLLFEHQNIDQDTGEDEFYSQSKSNQCVGCGEQGHYMRYR